MLVVHGPPGLDYAAILKSSVPREVVRAQRFLIAEHDDADRIWIEQASAPNSIPVANR